MYIILCIALIHEGWYIKSTWLWQQVSKTKQNKTKCWKDSQ